LAATGALIGATVACIVTLALVALFALRAPSSVLLPSRGGLQSHGAARLPISLPPSASSSSASSAFLFGRRTYELFAGYWGVRAAINPIAAALNTRPKYVASTTLTDPQWADTTVVSGDVAAAIDEPKAKPGGELQLHGSGALTRWLLDNDLVDEINLLIVPVVVGQGTRLFPGTGPDIALDLVDSRAFPKGVTIQVYRPAGRPHYATATAA
jgi:dihydrofolate reductase